MLEIFINPEAVSHLGEYGGFVSVIAVCLAFVIYMMHWDSKNKSNDVHAHTREDMKEDKVTQDAGDMPAPAETDNEPAPDMIEQKEEPVREEAAIAANGQAAESHEAPTDIEPEKAADEDMLMPMMRRRAIEIITDPEHSWKGTDKDMILTVILSSVEMQTKNESWCSVDVPRRRYLERLCGVIGKNYTENTWYSDEDSCQARKELFKFLFNLEWVLDISEEQWFRDCIHRMIEQEKS